MAAEALTVGAGVATVVFQAKTALWDPLRQTITSSNDMDEVYIALDEAMQMLRAKRDDHQILIRRHEATKLPSNSYNNWIRRVNAVEDDVTGLMSRYPKERRRSRLFCLHPRSNFSEKMKKRGLQVINYMEEGNQLKDFLIDKEPERVVKMIAPDIKNILTLQGPMEQMLQWLSIPKVTGIRIHGLIGSGKTVMMQNLNNSETVSKMFDIVIWVTVSREGSKGNLGTEHLQHVIAQRLKMDVENGSQTDDTAARIREELKNRKFLLLLDDVKEDLDFERVGVPLSNSGSKIVFTTRLRHVCFSIASRHVNVPRLNKKEAMNVFRTILGRPDLEADPNIKRLMPQVVDLCGNLPLMIKVAAGAFRVKETEESWRDGLKNLQKWPEKDDDSMREMFKLLNFCCDYLSGVRRKCFLYSAMYPEDSNIQKESLLENWAAEKLLGDDAEESQVYGREILEHLKTVCLLENGVSTHHVRMHKLIRQAALHNLSSDNEHENLVRSGDAIGSIPAVSQWNQMRWISLVDGKLDALPDEPCCSRLSTLFLQKNPNLKEIPASFFQHMKNLCVLDLHSTGILALPLSLLGLVSLKALYLQRCVDLVKLPSEMKELKQLELLDIRGSGMHKVPPQVRNMIRLRRLLVSFTISGHENDHENVISSCKVISEISALKELVIDAKEGFYTLLPAIMKHVHTLIKLSTLQFFLPGEVIDVVKVVDGTPKIYLPEEGSLRSFVGRGDNFEFASFQVFIGCHLSSHPQIPKFSLYDKYVRYCGGESIEQAVSKVLSGADAFELINHKEIEHLSAFEIESMSRVRGCFIERCGKFKTVVIGSHANGGSILPNLERLHMIDLPELRSIWEGPTQRLSKLKTLVLSNCPSMAMVCSFAVILQLPAIQHLEIRDCSGMVEIITDCDKVGAHRIQNLKKLVLVNMPLLSSILSNDSFEWPSLERLKIQGCPCLKRLPFNERSASKMSSVNAEESWWESLEISRAFKDHFRPYCAFS